LYCGRAEKFRLRFVYDLDHFVQLRTLPFTNFFIPLERRWILCTEDNTMIKIS